MVNKEKAEKIFFTDFLGLPVSNIPESSIITVKKRYELLPSYTSFLGEEEKLIIFFQQMSSRYLISTRFLLPWYKESLLAVASGDIEIRMNGLVLLQKIAPRIYIYNYSDFIKNAPIFCDNKDLVLSNLDEYISNNKDRECVNIALDFKYILSSSDKSNKDLLLLLKKFPEHDKILMLHREILIPSFSDFRCNEEEIEKILSSKDKRLANRIKRHWLNEAFKKITSGNISEGVEDSLYLMRTYSKYSSILSYLLKTLPYLSDKDKNNIIIAWQENIGYRSVLVRYIDTINNVQSGSYPSLYKNIKDNGDKGKKSFRFIGSEAEISDYLSQELFKRMKGLYFPRHKKRRQPEGSKYLSNFIKRTFPREYNNFMEDTYNKFQQSQEKGIRHSKYLLFFYDTDMQFLFKKQKERNR